MVREPYFFDLNGAPRQVRVRDRSLPVGQTGGPEGRRDQPAPCRGADPRGGDGAVRDRR